MEMDKLSLKGQIAAQMVAEWGWPGLLTGIAELAEQQGQAAATVGQDPPLARALHIIRRDATAAANNFPKGV